MGLGVGVVTETALTDSLLGCGHVFPSLTQLAQVPYEQILPLSVSWGWAFLPTWSCPLYRVQSLWDLTLTESIRDLCTFHK